MTPTPLTAMLMLVLACLPARAATSGSGSGRSGAVAFQILQPALVEPDPLTGLSIPACIPHHRFPFYFSPLWFSGMPAQLPEIPPLVGDQIVWYNLTTYPPFSYIPSFFTDSLNVSFSDVGCQVLDPSLLTVPIVTCATARPSSADE